MTSAPPFALAASLQAKQKLVVDKLVAKQHKKQAITKQKVRTIYVEKDSTGCADNRALTSMLNALRPSTDRPKTDK